MSKRDVGQDLTKLLDAAPDLGGLDAPDLHGVEIVEILIDERGEVKDACLLRGVREDVDLRVMAAIRQWRFEPVRLRHWTPPDVAVPGVITVSLRIGKESAVVTLRFGMDAVRWSVLC